MTGPHSSHVTRYSDSSFYDEKCVNCGATDTLGGWGLLAAPCPNAPAPPAPEPTPQVCEEVTEKLPSLTDFIAEAVYEETANGTYDCDRVWSAWSYGTMSADDFKDTSDRADEIAVTVRDKLLSHPAICRAQKLEDAMEKFPSLQRNHGPFDPTPIIDWYRTYVWPLQTLPKIKESIDA